MVIFFQGGPGGPATFWPGGSSNYAERKTQPIIDEEGEMRRNIRGMRTIMGGAVLIAALAGLTAGQAAPLNEPDQSAAEQPLFASVSSYVHADVNRLEKYMVSSLEQSTDGVVEDALREITRVKLAQPEAGAKRVMQKIRDLATDGKTPAIRYKAMLSLLVFENPPLFAELKEREFRSAEEMFSAIADSLKSSVLAGKY